MTRDHRSLLALYALLCVTRAAGSFRDARAFEKKVSVLLKEEPENPKCFAEGRKDFTCFWEEDEPRSVDQYTFTYSYQNENSSRCPLTVVRVASGRKLYVCHLSRTQMFVQMDIKVHRGGTLVHSRSLLIELVFLLDPPANVTVSGTGQQGQLNVSWVPPPLKYMDDSMMYEVAFAPEDQHLPQVEEVRAGSEMMLRGLQPATRYKVRVRVKLDGISYNGYWSAWSEPVFQDTPPAELNPLIVSLTLIISFIATLLLLIVLMSQRSFLIEKIWPTIPTPDSKFQGLFTDYGGDFREWLGQTNGGLWFSPELFYSDERPTSLEVLSELHPLPPLPSPPLTLKTRGARLPGTTEETRVQVGLEDRAPQRHRLMEHLHQEPAPCTSLLESHDAYVTLSGEDERLEEAPLASRSPLVSESHSDLGSTPQSSGSGRLSSQSSFEYPHRGRTHAGVVYAYMAVADSGVSVDYSPMSRTDDVGKVVVYANELPAPIGTFPPRPNPVQNP